MDISRRDYFAAHAPTEIPAWFDIDNQLPDKPLPPKRPLGPSDDVYTDWKYMEEFVGGDPSLWEARDFPGDRPPLSLHVAAVKSFGLKMKEHREALELWQMKCAALQAEYDRTYFVAWRVHYANMMVEAIGA